MHQIQTVQPINDYHISLRLLSIQPPLPPYSPTQLRPQFAPANRTHPYYVPALNTLRYIADRSSLYSTHSQLECKLHRLIPVTSAYVDTQRLQGTWSTTRPSSRASDHQSRLMTRMCHLPLDPLPLPLSHARPCPHALCPILPAAGPAPR